MNRIDMLHLTEAAMFSPLLLSSTQLDPAFANFSVIPVNVEKRQHEKF